MRKTKLEKSKELEKFIGLVESSYREIVDNKELLDQLISATPYRYLNALKLGSRPSKRPEGSASIASLRAIPWVLCWTQVRCLWPTWWGIGSAWNKLNSEEKASLRRFFKSSPFFSSFVKTLGYSLAKVELDVWQLYFPKKERSQFILPFEEELSATKKFVLEVSEKNRLIWHRPWLEESIRLRSPHIHILNLLQIIAMRSKNEKLLRETIVGIACGMLTTG